MNRPLSVPVTNYTSDNIGNINPFRYRGYYFDSETNFYYLNSRYYDPETKRFVNADSISIIGATPDGLTDKNLYAYCDNNPIMRSDDDGEFWHVLGGALIGFAGQLVSDLVTSAIEGELSFSHWSCYVGATIGGAVGALIPGSQVLSDIVSSAVTTVISSVSYNIESAIVGRDEYYSFGEIYCATVENSLFAAAVGGIFRNSTVYSKLPTKKIFKTQIGVNDLVGGVVSSSADAGRNHMLGLIPNTHIWESPNVERWYPFK